MKRLFFGKKAEGGVALSTETLIKVTLSALAIIALLLFSVKIYHVFVPDTEKATIRNFEQLVATLKNMDDGASFSSYPIFVDEDYAIVGYPGGANAASGMCVPYNILTETDNPKPEQCGIGTEGCLCLCENTADFATLCQENDKVQQCATAETLGEAYSFTGGVYTDGGSCSFALVYGAAKAQSIYIKKNEETIRICTKECGAQSASQETSDLATLLTSGGTIILHYEIRITDTDYLGMPPGYEQTLTYDSSSKKYTVEESTYWPYSSEPQKKTTTHTSIEEVVSYLKTQVSWPEAAKPAGITEGGTTTITVSLQAEGYNRKEYGTYTPDTISTFFETLVTESRAQTATTTLTGKNLLILGDSQTMGDYGSTLYGLLKTEDNTVNEYAVCGAKPSFFIKGSSIPSCDARYIYDDGSDDGNAETITSGTTPLLTDLLSEHQPTLVFVTFASNMLKGYSNERIDEEGISADVTAFADKIITAGASCAWVGPPQGPRYADLDEYRRFKEIIKESAEEAGCTFIDSEQYTYFAFCGDDAFGCEDEDPHFSNHGAAGKAVAQAWAEGVYDTYAASLLS